MITRALYGVCAQSKAQIIATERFAPTDEDAGELLRRG